ncbi:hypothetical protein [Streptomyces sp. NBC_00893]|uniref:hypothetical protein n=1 Tax=Streptomyces sp. NBC_00893 TaxID=2975862 RepID=UPI0022515A4B|nr:hypothetical protein [Streptomyces sp. NBC_00893]MCX4851312.1 hypothetical protein [Streptomyces sp. NBC_00893]
MNGALTVRTVIDGTEYTQDDIRRRVRSTLRRTPDPAATVALRLLGASPGGT